MTNVNYKAIQDEIRQACEKIMEAGARLCRAFEQAEREKIAEEMERIADAIDDDQDREAILKYLQTLKK